MSASPAARSPETRPAGRARSASSLALAILAAVAVVVGGSCLYVREELLDAHAFADRTVSALAKAPVRHVASREIVVQVIDQSSPDLLAARPLITSVVDTIVGTQQFRGALHLVAEHAHRLLFDRGGNVVFDIADAGTVVISALRTLSPQIAAKIPKNIDGKLLDLRRQSFAVRTLRVADKVRLLGIVGPLLALALLALAVAIAPRRRQAVTRCAAALAIAGTAVFFDLILLRHATIANLFGSEELSNADVRAAGGALWDSYLGNLSDWALGLAVLAAIVTAASASVLRPYTADAGLTRLRARLWPPRSTGGRVLRGALALLSGLVLVGDPSLAIDIVGVFGGVLLVYFGSGELLSAAGVPPEHELPSLRRYRAGLAATAVSLGVLIGGAAIALGVSGHTTSRAPASEGAEHVQRLRRSSAPGVSSRSSSPGTHNSMSAADSPGWLIANQDRDRARSSTTACALFKISTHYASRQTRGGVRTDIAAEGANANRVVGEAHHGARVGAAAAQRLGRLRVARARASATVWLCHTLCELGATRWSTSWPSIRRFLQRNPGQVIILFDEDYVSERRSAERLQARRTVLAPRRAARAASRCRRSAQLVRSQHNVVVFTQKPVSGRYPLGHVRVRRGSRTRRSGRASPISSPASSIAGCSSNPLLMMNDWADVFPPRRSPNLPLVKRASSCSAPRQCEPNARTIPNLILTDFYNRGDVVGAVRDLNGLGDQKPAPIVRLEARH